jgi:ABC-type phosphate transport system substrate-binding protein
MKLKTIVAVCAMAFAGQAFAVTPTPSVANASAVKLFISGSSALQNTIGQIANGLFTAGTMSVFFDGTATATGASGKNYRAYAGTFSATTAAGLAGTTGVIFETGAGGSIMGVVPVANATTVARLDLSLDTNCTLQTAVDAVTGAPLYSCVPTVLAVPDAGVSDVEPAMFVGINVPAGSSAATPAVVSALVSTSTIAQPMGIIVTPNTAITNLTKAQVTGLMNGFSSDWSFVDAAYAAGPVIVCKRTAGSGTQAAINNFFFGVPCAAGVQVPAVAQAVAGGYTVIENSSSGAEASCMTAAQLGTAAGYTININTGAISTAAASATQIVLPAGGRAIGLMGVDRPAATVKNAGITTGSATVAIPELYNFISINGVAPTVENASTGAYDVVVNNAWNKRAATVAGIAPLAGAQLTLLNDMQTRSGDKLVLGASKVPAVAGVLALADAVLLNYDPTLTATGTLLNPVMRTSKANSCQPAVQVQ